MTVTEFQEALGRGLESAVLVLEEKQNIEQYKETVLWSCLHRQSWDDQRKEGIGEYLYRILRKFKEDEYFLEEISKIYHKIEISYPVFEQLTEILCFFAMDGNKRAKKLMNQKYQVLYRRIGSKELCRKDLEHKKNLKESKIPEKKETAAFNKKQAEQKKEENKRLLGDEWLKQWEQLCICLISLGEFPSYQRIMKDIGSLYLKGYRNIEFYRFHESSLKIFGKNRIEKYLETNLECTLAVNAYCQEMKRKEKPDGNKQDEKMQD